MIVTVTPGKVLSATEAWTYAKFNQGFQPTFLNGFVEVDQTDIGDGTLTIPNVLRGVSAVNRLFVLNGDEVWASDQLDYTRFSIFNELRINEGPPTRPAPHSEWS